MQLIQIPLSALRAVVLFILLALLAGLAYLGIQQVGRPTQASSQGGYTSPAISVPALGSQEWQPVAWNPAYQAVSLAAPTSVTPLAPPDLPMPSGDYCSYISQITGQPCQWQVNHKQYQDGSETIEVELRSGDQILARGNAMKVDLRELVEVNKTYPVGHGWLDYIEVARWLERAGFGRLMLQAIDQILQRQANGGPVVKIFVDAAGWATRVLPPGYDQFGEKVYIYLVGS